MTTDDARLDELYQLPLPAFTAARNALARTFKGPDAQRIKRLGKPAVVPWTINQLYWHARKTYDQVVATGRALRDVQIAALKGRNADIRSAMEEHRKAVAAAVREGLALALKQGAHPPPDQLARMLEAVTLARESADPPGRFTELIQPSGFEALVGIAPSAEGHPHTKPSPDAATVAAPRSGPRLVTTPPAARKANPAEERRQAAEAQRLAAEERQRERERAAEERRQEKERAAARARAEAEVRAAEHQLSQAREVLQRAERALEAARSAVADAERTLATARDGRMLSSPHV